jgi:aryl-alcohol dehydrogenase
MWNVSVAEPWPDEVLVRIVATGVCQTYAHSRKQAYPVPLPVIPGREGAGIVESVGPAVRETPRGWRSTLFRRLLLPVVR